MSGIPSPAFGRVASLRTHASLVRSALRAAQAGSDAFVTSASDGPRSDSTRARLTMQSQYSRSPQYEGVRADDARRRGPMRVSPPCRHATWPGSHGDRAAGVDRATMPLEAVSRRKAKAYLA